MGAWSEADRRPVPLMATGSFACSHWILDTGDPKIRDRAPLVTAKLVGDIFLGTNDACDTSESVIDVFRISNE